MKHWIIFLLTLCSSTVSAQQTPYQLWGAVRDAFTRESIRNVHLTLMTPDSVEIAKDVSCGSTPGNPNFTVTDIPGSGTYILRCEKEGYTTIDTPVKLKYSRLRQTRIFLDKDILMTKEMTRKLKEVEVKATLVKMVMKGDTMVYNAAAFQLAQGSMLDELVRQLPGVRLENGQITVNGRFVSSLLLNGEDFFKGNPKIALDNLPAYMVDN